VGQVRETATVFVTEPDEGRYAVNGCGESHLLKDRDQAFARARAICVAEARAAALRSGAESPVIELQEHIDMPLIEGLEKLIEARFTASASGRPRIAGK